MSELEINEYQKGKIYKLLNAVNDEVYVSSTCQKYLSKRMGKHKEDASKHATPIYNLMNNLGYDKFYIELLEYYPCDSKDELTAREGYWIRQIGTINRRTEGRTKKEYSSENKVDILDKRKHYYEYHKQEKAEYSKSYNTQNKGKIKEYGNQYRLKHVERIQEYRLLNKEKQHDYHIINLDKVHAKHKEYHETHKDALNAKSVCECGGCFTLKNKHKHLKTKLHTNYEVNKIK